MGRKKKFSRIGILDTAIEAFRHKGFKLTTVEDLERITGVNRSGLYTEFADKEELFLAALHRYIETCGVEGLLSSTPLGWTNVEQFLIAATTNKCGPLGCLPANPIRDLEQLPAEARDLLTSNYELTKRLLSRNIKAECPRSKASEIAETVLTFFFGIRVEYALKKKQASTLKQVVIFINHLRATT